MKGAAADAQRAREEAARRARRQVRLYCAANGLDRLGTLTYAGEGQHDPRALRLEVAGFFRQLRDALGGRALPYVWVPEWHKTDHGLHVHFAVGEYVPRALIEEAWGRGFVHIKRLGDLPHGAGSWERSWVAARYLSKYVGKAFDAQGVLGQHRYDVAQGFKPRIVQFRATTRQAVEASAVAKMGAEPEVRWSSYDVEGWAAPPALWLAWR